MKQPLVPGTLVTLDEITAYFDVESRTVRRWRDERGFPNPSLYGGVQRWRAEDVLRWQFAEEKSADNRGQSRTTEREAQKPTRRARDQD